MANTPEVSLLAYGPLAIDSPMPEFTYDVFLSHNAKDRPRVRRLAERLKQAGLRVWFDEWNLRPGEIIRPQIDEGLKQSRALLLCISPNALASDWVSQERRIAIHRDPDSTDGRFIPLLLADCEMPATLRHYTYVDYREDTNAAFAELLAACRTESTDATPTAEPLSRKNRATRKRREKQPAEVDPLAVLERELSGHEEWINQVVFSPDGQWLASASDDTSVKIWNLKEGRCQGTLNGHTAEVHSVAFTPDGKRVFSGSSDGTVRLWEVMTCREMAQVIANQDMITSVATLQDNTRVVSAGADGTLKIRKLPSLECLQTIEGGSGVRIFLCCAVDRAGQRVLVGDAEGQIWVYSLQSGECLATLKGHSEHVHSVQFTPDEQSAISCSSDATIKVWNLEANSCQMTLEGHRYWVSSIGVSSNGDLVSVDPQEKAVRFWDWKSGQSLHAFEPPDGTPTCTAFSSDGSHLAIGMADPTTIRVYRLTGVRPTPSAEAAAIYVNAKVVLLGEGTVGKTSLAHRLIDDKYVIRDRTHGMNVWRLDLPLPPDATREREALLWDLAGQEDYRLIHRLFLEETALALLLINPQTSDPFADAGHWLKALRTAAAGGEMSRESARLLILSQTDVGGMKLSAAKIAQFCEQYGFANWIPTSAKTGENCSDEKNGGQPSTLKRLIADTIPWDKLSWTSTPRLLAELKNAMMAMRDERDIRLLRFAELLQRLEQTLPGKSFGESDVRTAVTLLSNQGLVRALKFGDLVLLQPELLNGYAGAIIRAARAHIDEIGCVQESDIYSPTFDFTGVERLKHRADEELLLRALVQTFLDRSLCIAEETPRGRQLVFPSQYRREKNSPKNPDIFVSYTFGGEWQTVWTTLVVRLWYSQEFERHDLWSNAAEFHSNKGHTLGLMIKKGDDGTASISCYFDVDVVDELKAMFIEYVHRHLALYACDVSRDRRYVCTCGTPVKDFETVRKRLDARKEFITCQACDKHVLLIDFIEQRLKSDPVARQILKMEEEAARQLDTQALEQILIGHMMAVAGEANQIFRPVSMFDYGIDGEMEFKDHDGKPSGQRIYVQLKSGNSYLRTRQSDGREVFDVKNDRHLEYWVNQPADVYLVIRQTDKASRDETIRWMNVTQYLKARTDTDKTSRQIVFDGEKLDMEAVWRVRDKFCPPPMVRAAER